MRRDKGRDENGWRETTPGGEDERRERERGRWKERGDLGGRRKKEREAKREGRKKRKKSEESEERKMKRRR